MWGLSCMIYWLVLSSLNWRRFHSILLGPTYYSEAPMLKQNDYGYMHNMVRILEGENGQCRSERLLLFWKKVVGTFQRKIGIPVGMEDEKDI